MPETVFEFREEDSRIFGKTMRPVVDVTISHGGKKLTMPFYADSGADITLIPKSAGDFLGLQVKSGEIKEVQGVGSRQVPVVIKKLRLRIGDKEFEADVAWALIEEVPLLLGRKDVFGNFDITFAKSRTIFRY